MLVARGYSARHPRTRASGAGCTRVRHGSPAKNPANVPNRSFAASSCCGSPAHDVTRLEQSDPGWRPSWWHTGTVNDAPGAPSLVGGASEATPADAGRSVDVLVHAAEATDQLGDHTHRDLGFFPQQCRMFHDDSPSVRRSVVATTAAERGRPSRTLISPNESPGPNVATTSPSTRASAVPLTTE
jgi:hypothetical protein